MTQLGRLEGVPSPGHPPPILGLTVFQPWTADSFTEGLGTFRTTVVRLAVGLGVEVVP